MQYNDFLDTDVPYDEIPEEYLAKPASTANIDPGRQLQQTIDGAFRKAAGPANTDEHAERAMDTSKSTQKAVKELAEDFEALRSCYQKLPAAVRASEHNHVASFRNAQGNVNSLLARMADVEKLLGNSKYKEAYNRSCTVCDGLDSVGQQIAQLRKVVDSLEGSY
ncbi:hypothetical protein Slin14017_G074350 [Septoria linicola]|nr:hypothetical protein Slin14017_G074350 [Septoria linicola]